jgi:hypothetical protein
MGEDRGKGKVESRKESVLGKGASAKSKTLSLVEGGKGSS